jgi:alkanesulfonate monooxygenase SsuD/methylene tetrahydromethanopterin reductase-like flavin-dependent oxidoreductase (luciferase family)
VVCADTDEESDHLAKTVDLNLTWRNKGEYHPLASPEDAAKYPFTDAEKVAIAKNRARMSVGSPATVKAKLEALIASTNADEVMVTTMIHGHAARKRSYELLAQAFGLTAR